MVIFIYFLYFFKSRQIKKKLLLTKFFNKIKKLLDKFDFNNHHNMNNQTTTENIVKMMDRSLIVIHQEIKKI
jgi:hypothetical protein